MERLLEHLDLQEPDVFDNEESVFHQEPADEDAAEEAASDSSPDDMTCAICLERTPLTDIALVKGCEHQHCVHCILQWAMHKEWCPQCKKPFNYLLTHRQLDGTLTDYLTEESVVLLKRARWFEDHMRAKEQARAAAMPILASGGASSSRGYAIADDAQEGEARDWADFYEDYVDAELEEDEEIEQYYFSSAAGRARVVLGNRRWGEGGYMRAGRMYARPVQHNARTTPNAAGGKAAGKAAAGKAAAPAGSSPGASSSSRAAAGPSCAGSSPGASSSRAAATAGPSGAGSSSSAAAGSSSPAAAGASSGAGSGAGSSGAGGLGCSSGAGAGSSRGRSSVAAAAASSSSAGNWWNDDGDDDDFEYDEDFPRMGGGGGGSSSGGNRRGNSGSRSRSRPDRPTGMIKPVRQVPKNSPVCSMAAGPLVSPLGKSPGGGGFCVGSWGASGGGSGPAAGGGQMASTPGSGRRAKRNARRAAVDGSGEWD